MVDFVDPLLEKDKNALDLLFCRDIAFCACNVVNDCWGSVHLSNIIILEMLYSGRNESKFDLYSLQWRDQLLFGRLVFWSMEEAV